MGQLDGRVAIVTGGGGGIGKAMAEAMVAEGATVVVSDVSGEEETVAAQLGDAASAMRADVSSEADVKALIEGTVERHGKLDILCNNAGIDGELGPLAECSLENFEQVIAVNLRGVFLGIRYGVPAMLAGDGGSIINTASALSHIGMAGTGPYAAAKAGVLGLTRTAAVEYSGAGIRINAICPGVVRTAMMIEIEKNAPDVWKEVLTVSEAVPSKRIAEPDEIAAAAVFLAGDGSRFITGTSINVDGGWTVA